jgi:hypothetical protein
MKLRVLAVTALVVAFPAAAAAMDVTTWLAKADALKAKGAGALLSKDYKLLQSEIKSNAAALKAEREAAQAAGRKPAYCSAGKIGLDRDEVMAILRAVPEAQRARTQVKDALRAGLARKYPCR